MVILENTGLRDSDIRRIQDTFAKFEQIEQAILYGSRALGTYRPASDIDLTLVGKNLDLAALQAIDSELDDLYLPYKFDISVLAEIENPDLINHIERFGKVFYSKNDRNPIL